MADYYSVLARAVSGLDLNTPAARRRLYERARSALLSEMQNADPPIARFEIMVAQKALDTAIEQVEANFGLLAALEPFEGEVKPTVPETAGENVEEYWEPYERVQPNSVAPASLIPSRALMPRRPPANQNVAGRGSLSGFRRLFRWRSARSMDVSEEEDTGRDTWLTELLARASREEDEDYQDFTPKRASNRNVYPG